MNRYIKLLTVTEYGNPVLLEDEKYTSSEVEVYRVTDVSIYLGDVKKYTNGVCILTNHRILWRGDKLNLCISLGLIDRVEVQTRVFHSEKLVLYLLPVLVTVEGVSESLPAPDPGYVKLSFHSGYRQVFQRHLERVLVNKSWIVYEKKHIASTISSSNAGIGGILRKKELEKKKADITLSEAFQDLDALMGLAKDLVRLADTFAAKCDGNSEDEFNSVLLNLGIPSPVTKESAGSLYHFELARQLAEFITPFIKESGGMMQLIDVYCLYNRARGTELISPDDLLTACKLYSNDTLSNIPLRVKTFGSGLCVLENTNFDKVQMAQQICSLIETKGPLSYLELTEILHTSIHIAKQYLNAAEELTLLCRDESTAGIRFWKNIFNTL